MPRAMFSSSPRSMRSPSTRIRSAATRPPRATVHARCGLEQRIARVAIAIGRRETVAAPLGERGGSAGDVGFRVRILHGHARQRHAGAASRGARGVDRPEQHDVGDALAREALGGREHARVLDLAQDELLAARRRQPADAIEDGAHFFLPRAPPMPAGLRPGAADLVGPRRDAF